MNYRWKENKKRTTFVLSLGLVLGLDLEGKSLEPTGIVVAVSDINKSLISQMESVIYKGEKKEEEESDKTTQTPLN